MKGVKTRTICAIILVCILIALSGVLAACQNNEGKQFNSYQYFNTETTLVLFGNFARKADIDHAEKVWSEVKEILSSIENAISVEEGSDIFAFNNHSGGLLEISQHTYNILTQAKKLYEFTQGAFNPSLGLHVDLWGFSPRFSKASYEPSKDYDREDYKNNIPSAEYIDGFAPLTDFSKVTLSTSDGKYFVSKPNDKVTINGKEYTMNINLGGLGKGYATDVITDYLKKEGIKDGYISVGRSSLTVLNNAIILADAPKPTDWKVGLINPNDTTKQYGHMFLNNISLSSSGDYENYYEIGGKRYSHIIDGNTFYPVDNTITSVTVVSSSATYCDALSTALCVMGIDKAKEFVQENMFDDRVVISYKNGENLQVFTSENGNFELTDTTFTVDVQKGAK